MTFCESCKRIGKLTVTVTVSSLLSFCIHTKNYFRRSGYAHYITRNLKDKRLTDLTHQLLFVSFRYAHNYLEKKNLELKQYLQRYLQQN